MSAINPFRKDAWTRQDPRLPNAYAQLTRNASARSAPLLWHRGRVQFPIMRQYEAETCYQANGRIVFSPSEGSLSFGLPCKAVSGGSRYRLTTADGTRNGIALGLGRCP